MLSEIEFERYVSYENKLSDKAISYIKMVRESEPSRRVGIHTKSNLCSWIFSEKIERTVSIESRSAERAFFLLCEYDESVIEIWEQPEPVLIQKTYKNGSKRNSSYTPDFLILTNEGPQVIEVKTSDEIEEKLNKYKKDWVRNDEGIVEYLPAKDVFNAMGIDFNVFEYKDDFRYLVSNAAILMRSRRSDPVSDEYIEKVKKAMEEKIVWTLEDLKTRLSSDSYGPLVKLIDMQVLCIDLKESLITIPDGCLVSISQKYLEAAKDNFNLEKIYKREVLDPLSDADIPSIADAANVLEKMDKIKKGEKGRSIRRWKQLIKEGKKLGLNQFQSLIPKSNNSGNRKPKINREVSDFVDSYLKNEHAESQGISLYRSYIRYKELAKKHHTFYDPVSRQTFMARLKKIPPENIAKKRGGKRAENAALAATNPIKRNNKASYSWEVASIDHYEADIYLVLYSDDKKAYVQRPYVTAMIDLYSGVILALAISFLPPSRRSIAKVMRDCVRKHGKLPVEIIVDRGSDFKSTYFESLLAHYSISYTLRPTSHPRYGSEIEGFFGEFKREWLCQRAGNIADFKEARAVDGKKSPSKSAILDIEDSYREINEFNEWRDNKCRGSERYSAREKFERSQKDFSFIANKVEYDTEFQLVTAVEHKKYKINPQRGIHVRDLWYSTPAFKNIQGRMKSVQVRIDPENPYVVYALVNSKWEFCYHSDINLYGAKSQEKQIAEGLIKYEAATLRTKIKEQEDLDLSVLRTEMDLILEKKNKSKSDENKLDLTIEIDSPKNKRDINIRPIDFKEWG